jgi:hypothetical protein
MRITRVEKILNKIRLWIAGYLNTRYPEMCWAELVMWALGYTTFRETFTEGGCNNQECSGNEPSDSYCGKCACTGRLYRNQPEVKHD